MDIENLLRSLNEHKVEFVIIGATAFPTHDYARATLGRPKDLEDLKALKILKKTRPENATLTNRYFGK
jgi:predicted nucleotidyltransferase